MIAPPRFTFPILNPSTFSLFVLLATLTTMLTAIATALMMVAVTMIQMMRIVIMKALTDGLLRNVREMAALHWTVRQSLASPHSPWTHLCQDMFLECNLYSVPWSPFQSIEIQMRVLELCFETKVIGQVRILIGHEPRLASWSQAMEHFNRIDYKFKYLE